MRTHRSLSSLPLFSSIEKCLSSSLMRPNPVLLLIFCLISSLRQLSFSVKLLIINQTRIILEVYILFLIMGLSIYHFFCLTLLVLVAFTAEQPTRLSYFIEYEVEQEDDFIEVSLTIQSQSRSLVEALKNAKATASEVSTLANNYCKEHFKKGKGDCKEAVDVSSFEIQPNYQIVRKESTFSAFIVKHEVTISVFNTEAIGYLIDSFLKYPDLTINGFQWQALNEIDPEETAIKEGLEQGEGLCEQVGLTLGKVLNIEEIVDEEEEPAPAGDDQEEEEEEEPEVIVYKFEVECAAKKPKAK